MSEKLIYAHRDRPEWVEPRADEGWFEVEAQILEDGSVLIVIPFAMREFQMHGQRAWCRTISTPPLIRSDGEHPMTPSCGLSYLASLLRLYYLIESATRKTLEPLRRFFTER